MSGKYSQIKRTMPTSFTSGCFRLHSADKVRKSFCMLSNNFLAWAGLLCPRLAILDKTAQALDVSLYAGF